MITLDDIKRLFQTLEDYEKSFEKRKDYETDRCKDYTEERTPATGHTYLHILD